MAVPERTCVGPECDRRAGWLGFCGSHYHQQRLGKELTPLRAYTKSWDDPICSVPDCGRKHKARGLCKTHGDHMRKYGELREIKTYGVYVTCEIVGCETKSLVKRRCPSHLQWGYNLSRFNLTLEQYVAMLDAQGGVCAICGGTNPNARIALSVDHNHECCPGDRSCGKCIRGLLCANCNNGLGRMKDDPARLRAAADYLESHAAD